MNRKEMERVARALKRVHRHHDDRGKYAELDGLFAAADALAEEFGLDKLRFLRSCGFRSAQEPVEG